MLLRQLPSALAAYAGLGRVLPIRRGAGVNQKLLLDYARLLAAGKENNFICQFIFVLLKPIKYL